MMNSPPSEQLSDEVIPLFDVMVLTNGLGKLATIRPLPFKQAKYFYYWLTNIKHKNAVIVEQVDLSSVEWEGPDAIH